MATSASTIVVTHAVSSTSTGCSVDGAPGVGEKLDAVLVGDNLSVEIAHGEIFGTIDPDGSEEGVVGVVESGEEILHEFLLVNRSARCCELIGEPLHLGEELRRGHVVLLRLGEGNAQV
jgi:small ligand-binding sensory domain FIST